MESANTKLSDLQAELVRSSKSFPAQPHFKVIGRSYVGGVFDRKTRGKCGEIGHQNRQGFAAKFSFDSNGQRWANGGGSRPPGQELVDERDVASSPSLFFYCAFSIPFF
jgi:hypothetical protein